MFHALTMTIAMLVLRCIFIIACPRQDHLKFSGAPSGQGVGSMTQTLQISWPVECPLLLLKVWNFDFSKRLGKKESVSNIK
ncbi:hypothetical protein PoB_005376600 [Plakobranchus ocellatus]|uniref:Secreted protein n=1 Tax=Plakobranchus ocellatus TaxID=259542 RepID=A0AAV4C3D4_9GAST|nr:hypothetical protein PoB_005376600 [Plakobranchus ocellatus]